MLTFASRQSIRYDIVRLGNEWFGWNLQTVDKAKGTLQFREDVNIADSVEMDLFGYLKTGKNRRNVLPLPACLMPYLWSLTAVISNF